LTDSFHVIDNSLNEDNEITDKSKGQGQMSLQSLLGLIISHVHIKSHQFLLSSLSVFIAQTDIQSDTQTDKPTPPKAIPSSYSVAGWQVRVTRSPRIDAKG